MAKNQIPVILYNTIMIIGKKHWLVAKNHTSIVVQEVLSYFWQSSNCASFMPVSCVSNASVPSVQLATPCLHLQGLTTAASCLESSAVPSQMSSPEAPMPLVLGP